MPELAVQVYRRSNDEPAKAEIPSILHAQEFYAEKLASLDVSILKAQRVLEYFKTTHSTHQAAYDLCRSASSVVRRVPVDVWREIFLFCHPPQHRMIMSFSQIPLLLTQVCRSWRSVALSTPELWTRLYIPPLLVPADPIWSLPFQSVGQPDFLAGVPNIIHERCQLLKAVLSRSGTLPLSISIETPRMYEYRPYREAIGITQPGTQPLEALILNIFIAMSRVYDILESHIPRVEEAYISRCMIDHISEMDTQNILSSPRLRILRIHTLTTMPRYPNFIPSNWANLTIISIRSVSPTPWAKALLRKCTKLVECSLHILYSPPDDRAHNSLISLPDLKVLSITEGRMFSGHSLYPWMVIPNIQSLSCYEIELFPGPYYSSVTFLLPRLHGLQKLQINPAVFTNGSFSYICRVLPSLNHLVLGSTTHKSTGQWGPTINLFNVLAARYHPTPDKTEAVFPLPNLQFLEIHNAPISDLDLYNFIEAMLCPECPSHLRLRPGIVKLKSLTGTFKRIQQFNTPSPAMIKAGADFTVKLEYLKPNFYEHLSTQYGAAGVPTAS